MQGSNWWDGLIEVWYSPSGNVVQVWTYSPDQDWVQRSGDIPVTLQAGDVLGVRAHAAGWVEIYHNGMSVGIVDVTAWPYYANGGRIGLWLENITTIVDDFGGGNVP